MSHIPPLYLNDIQDILDDIARSMGRSVEVTTPSINVIAASAQVGEIDSHRADSILHRSPPPEPIPWLLSFGIQDSEKPVRLPAHEGFQLLPRMVFPLRQHGELVGHLWFIDSPQLSEEEVAAAGDYLERLTQLVGEYDAPLRTRAAQLDQLARTILSGNEGALALARDRDELPRDGTLTIHRVYLDGDQQRLTAELARPLHRRPFLTAMQHDSLVILESPLDSADTQQLRDEVASAALTAGGKIVAWGAASAAETSVGEAARRARLMADVAKLCGEEFLGWTQAGAWRLLVGWELNESTVRSISPDAAALLDDPRNSYWRTLLAYLDNARNVNATAAALYIHRATLHYRLERVREITGSGALDDGWRCVALHVALKLHAALEENGARGPVLSAP
ncbi:CdaR family transcriptional regulator [Corynebacterium sp.]|uniref:PucR family transcriptional regulator n=1 Tax=Corynebacterium sp. TaxID=1720 RepID=UPI0026DC5669|nr:PucR family transcriptional regulator [Corynebacterium sp.]MDO5032552.1 helix-turn-helix domain-containing protein [Corynebacterium sp.]